MDSALVPFLIFIHNHSLGEIIQLHNFKYYLSTDDCQRQIFILDFFSALHMYVLINVFIWISIKHLNLNISNCFPKCSCMFQLARLDPVVAQATKSESHLYSSVFSISHIQATGKSHLHSLYGLLLPLTITCVPRLIASHRVIDIIFSLPPCVFLCPIQSLLNTSQSSIKNMLDHVISMLNGSNGFPSNSE